MPSPADYATLARVGTLYYGDKLGILHRASKAETVDLGNTVYLSAGLSYSF